MARKTREEAAQTRQHILEAARQLFHRQGIVLTTLEQIGHLAGVTRGAVYWHFSDKSEIIKALRELLTDSMNQHVYSLLQNEDINDPLLGLEEGIKKIFIILNNDIKIREILAIWLTQGTLIKEFSESNESIVKMHKEFIAKLEEVYIRAANKGLLRTGLMPYILALDTDAFVVGLIRNWLLDACQVGIRENCSAIITEHVRLRRP